MKRVTFLIVLALCMMVNLLRAEEKPSKFSPQKFRAELECFIVQKVGLTPIEASSFFPLYDEMCRKQRVIFNDMRRIDKNNPMTNGECRKLIKERDKLDLELKKIQQQYHDKFMNVLPAKKVFDILKAEDEFHRRMLRGKGDRKKL